MRHHTVAGDPRDASVAFELARRVRGTAPRGPYEGGYDTLRGYDAAPVVHDAFDAGDVSYFAGRETERR